MTQPLRVLVLGASGQVGHALTALNGVGLTRQEADLASPLLAQQLRAALAIHKPTHVINAAAYTAVDRAEVESELAQAINAAAVETLGRVCKAAGVPVIHLSTDYVFDGRKPIG